MVKIKTAFYAWHLQLINNNNNSLWTVSERQSPRRGIRSSSKIMAHLRGRHCGQTIAGNGPQRPNSGPTVAAAAVGQRTALVRQCSLSVFVLLCTALFCISRSCIALSNVHQGTTAAAAAAVSASKRNDILTSS